MTQEEMQARIEKLERDLAAVLRVLWAMHNDGKSIANKIDKELKQVRDGLAIPVDLPELVVK